MVYAKIDENGDVIQFPYRLNPREERNVPEDVVKVDTQTNKPTNLKWYEGAWYDGIAKVGDIYIANYITGPKKYSSIEEKKNTLSILIRDAKIDSRNAADSGKITADQHQINLSILDSIDVDDESTYDLYNTIVL